MSDARAAKAWDLARRQHGIVARRQLLALGFSKRAIEQRIVRGRLHVVMRGIYAVGWPGMTSERRWMAAVLACGEEAMLSHRSAAALWEIGTESRGRIDITVRRHTELGRAGLRVHRRPATRAEDVGCCQGIPVTAPVRTLIDLATELSPTALERAVNETDKRNLIDPERLRLRLGDHAGEPGVRILRRLLDKRTFRLSDSDLEIFFRPIAAAAGLPPPLTKHVVNGWEVDFYWPDLGLVVETDGLRYHRTPSAQARDAKRDRTHVLAGMSPLRFTHFEIRYEPAHVEAALVRAASMLCTRSQS
ncbi:MAG TPA: type IV toxin-antitoxin system AbiEi family antitoxin domain-containing protein [Solirubrobacterales bacterium]|nr:type IV toxin-antitoxin system AbiEi family antitoxin domain-containing protein [Solirubrobacterales bacterium]